VWSSPEGGGETPCFILKLTNVQRMREFAQFENAELQLCSDNNLKLHNLNCKTLILITSILGIL